MEVSRQALGAAGLQRLGRRWLVELGRRGESLVRQSGEIALIFWGSMSAWLTGRLPLRELLGQMYWMGVQSLPIVMVTAILSGFVTSQQGGYQFTGSVPLYVLGSVVTSSIVLELGPVLTAIVFIGRVGARITAELGTMRVSEQVDALYSLGRDPIRVLAAPRVIAGMLVLPLLVAIADIVGIVAGMVAAEATLGLGNETFLYGARVFWHTFDLYYSVGKGAVFGFIIPLIAVHMGLRTHGGAEGVGRATTTSVVYMIMAMLFLDALFPTIFLR
ncbi:MAG TPA: ABC transporter permease [Longimicrobiaceae bacterium]|nr:ABC transporter permease [Longimicrobiaceae bacterium]